jgi:hypothetical protein
MIRTISIGSKNISNKMKKEVLDVIAKGLIVVLELAALALVVGAGIWLIALIITAIISIC